MVSAEFTLAASTVARHAAGIVAASNAAVVRGSCSSAWFLEAAGEIFVVGWGTEPGPLHILLSASPPANPEAGAAARIDGGAMLVATGRGLLRVDFSRAAVWDARPDWEQLRPGATAARSHIPQLAAAWRRGAGRVDGGEKLSYATLLAELMQPAFAGRAVSGCEAVIAGTRAGDRELVARGARLLAGLGPGLTPAGDDWLCGWMLAAHLAHPQPDPAPLNLAAAETTAYSAALLRRAAAGEASAPWHRLLAALVGTTVPATAIASHAQAVLAAGATSGAAALAGFVCGLE